MVVSYRWLQRFAKFAYAKKEFPILNRILVQQRMQRCALMKRDWIICMCQLAGEVAWFVFECVTMDRAGRGASCQIKILQNWYVFYWTKIPFCKGNESPGDVTKVWWWVYRYGCSAARSCPVEHLTLSAIFQSQPLIVFKYVLRLYAI